MEKRIKNRGTDFASPEDFQKHSRVVDAAADTLEYSGLPIDWIGDGRYATTVPEQHALIIGDTGCGKTRRLIIPSIKLISKTGESMVISDPKGELYLKTAGKLKEKGYEIRVLNLREPRNGDRWNPFEIIEKMYRSEDEDEKDKALIMLDEILDMMGSSIESDDDMYWSNVAKQFIKAICLTLLDYGDEGELSFSNIAVLEGQISSAIQRRIEAEGRMRDEEVRSFMDFFNMLDRTSLIKQNFQGAVNVTAGRTFSSVASNAHTMATVFVRQRAVQFLLSSTDFDIRSIGEKSTALFIILPDEMQTLYPLATMFINQIYSILCDLAYRNGGMLPVKVNFILDEFANFAKLDNIAPMLTASRSRGIRFFLVCQDVDQLESIYKSNGAAILRSNCQSWIYMGCRNTEFLRMLEALCGTYTETYTGKTMPLVSITDLQLLDTGESFVFIKGCSVKHCYLPDYGDIDFGEGEESPAEFPERNREKEKKAVDLVDLMIRATIKEETKKTTKKGSEAWRDGYALEVCRNIAEMDNETIDIIHSLVNERITSKYITIDEARADADLLYLVLEELLSKGGVPDKHNIKLKAAYRARLNEEEKIQKRIINRELECDIEEIFKKFVENRKNIETYLEEVGDAEEKGHYRNAQFRIKSVLLDILEMYRDTVEPEFDFGDTPQPEAKTEDTENSYDGKEDPEFEELFKECFGEVKLVNIAELRSRYKSNDGDNDDDDNEPTEQEKTDIGKLKEMARLYTELSRKKKGKLTDDDDDSDE